MDRRLLQRLFSKQPQIPFRDRHVQPYTYGYWLVQPFLIGYPYKYYYSQFEIAGWENVPTDKPVLFAISHRNAFMDSLAFVNTKGTQVWQLARGDAFSKPAMARLFYFFHMLPLWRERDGVDTKSENQPTFDACADLLLNNAMVGIYPEGNCVNEDHIRPLKKGICRIAFLAGERSDFTADVHIIPVGVMYTGADKFKQWQLIHFGKPIMLAEYYAQYQQNNAQAINILKEDIESAMKATASHVQHGPFHHDIVALSHVYARQRVLSRGEKYTPYKKFLAEKEIVPKLEALNTQDHDALKHLVHDFHAYRDALKQHNFRENTFDTSRHHPFTLVTMALYFVLMFPFALFGAVVNYIPYMIPHIFVQKKIKQQIFVSSAQYVIGLLLFPVYYLILFVIVWSILGSMLSGLIFLIAFPITGSIAFYYRRDFRKWLSALRFRRMLADTREALVEQRADLLRRLNAL